MSWIMHRLDAKGRKLYMPGPEDGAPDPHDNLSDGDGAFLPPGVSPYRGAGSRL